jgi:nucleotide-binding universal stress UspA family protein
MRGSNVFIVVGVDGSVAGDEAAKWAADEAARRHCELRLVHAYELPANAGYPEWNAYPDDLRPVLRDLGQKMVDRLTSELQTTHPELTVSTTVRYERASVVLREESEHALLTVVGSGNTSRLYGVLLGSVALAIASTNPAPVAVIHHGQTPRATGPVVVGVDGSHTSDAAVAFAFQAASVRGANLVAVHVWDDIIVPGTHKLENVLVDPARIEQEERALLAERIAGWADKYPDVSVQQTLVEGRAVNALLDQTKQAQLLVVGSHGRGGFAGMLLGSTSHSLILHSDCPVVVVRPASED